MLRRPLLALAVLALPVAARAAVIRNTTPYEIEVAVAYDSDRSIAGLGDNGAIDPDQGMRASGYTRLAPGAATSEMPASYVLVRVWHGSEVLELAPGDVSEGATMTDPGRTFPVKPDGNFTAAIKFGDPTRSGGNEEARRRQAVRQAGFEPKAFARLPAQGVVRFGPNTAQKVERFLRNTSQPGPILLHVVNGTPNEAQFEVRFLDPMGQLRIFNEKPSIKPGEEKVWGAPPGGIQVNGPRLMVGIRAADPFAPGGFRTWGCNKDGVIQGLATPPTWMTFNQRDGKGMTNYRFRVAL